MTRQASRLRALSAKAWRALSEALAKSFASRKATARAVARSSCWRRYAGRPKNQNPAANKISDAPATTSDFRTGVF